MGSWRGLVGFEVATMRHAEELAPLLRQADVDECRDGPGWGPLEALQRSIEASRFAVALRFAGELGAVFGVAVDEEEPVLGHRRVGCAWFLTGRACDRHRIALVRTARAVVPALHAASGCIELRNWVDARYTGAVALARLLGFEVVRTAPYGVRQLPFHLVARRG